MSLENNTDSALSKKSKKEIQDGFFNDSILADKEQKAAILTVEGDIKVTARAGSGKTSTIVNRALFLIKCYKIAPKEILILAFNKKAVEELKERLKDRLETREEENLPEVKTFHGLGKSICPPTGILVDDPENGKFEQSILIESALRGIDEEKISGLVKAHFKYELDSGVTYRIKVVKYENENITLKHKWLEYIESKGLNTLNGEYVKSRGEKYIADFLFENEIEYIYEHSYPNAGFAYHPDFIIPCYGKAKLSKTKVKLVSYTKDEQVFIKDSKDKYHRLYVTGLDEDQWECEMVKGRCSWVEKVEKEEEFTYNCYEFCEITEKDLYEIESGEVKSCSRLHKNEITGGIVIEYFGLDHADYLTEKEEKIKFWEEPAQKGYELLALNSSDFLKLKKDDSGKCYLSRRDFFNKLKENLEEKDLEGPIKKHPSKYKLAEQSEQPDENRMKNLEARIRYKTYTVSKLAESITQFIGRVSKKFATHDDFENSLKIYLNDNQSVTDLEEKFITISCECLKEYEKALKEENKVDFDRLLRKATEELRNPTEESKKATEEIKKIKYIFIDEFQDFSQLFNDLVLSVRDASDDAKLFCVGDDWQAINGFAGSDLKFFKGDSEASGSSEEERVIAFNKELNISTNYRSGKAIVESGNELMVNSEEVLKAEVSNDNKNKESKIEVHDLNAFELKLEDEIAKGWIKKEKSLELSHLHFMTAEIARRVLSKGKKVTLLSVTNWLTTGDNLEAFRNKVIEVLRLHTGLEEGLEDKIEISTTHKYKGKESDAIIILDALKTKYPLIHSNWIFTRCLGNTEKLIEDESRRLFYVALTRAKSDLHIITKTGNESIFIEDAGLGSEKKELVREKPYKDLKYTLIGLPRFDYKDNVENRNILNEWKIKTNIVQIDGEDLIPQEAEDKIGSFYCVFPDVDEEKSVLESVKDAFADVNEEEGITPVLMEQSSARCFIGLPRFDYKGESETPNKKNGEILTEWKIKTNAKDEDENTIREKIIEGAGSFYSIPCGEVNESVLEESVKEAFAHVKNEKKTYDDVNEEKGITPVLVMKRSERCFIGLPRFDYKGDSKIPNKKNGEILNDWKKKTNAEEEFKGVEKFKIQTKTFQKIGKEIEKNTLVKVGSFYSIPCGEENESDILKSIETAFAHVDEGITPVFVMKRSARCFIGLPYFDYNKKNWNILDKWKIKTNAKEEDENTIGEEIIEGAGSFYSIPCDEENESELLESVKTAFGGVVHNGKKGITPVFVKKRIKPDYK